MFLYVDNEAVKEEHIYDFLKFTFENAGELATDVGYVSLPQEKYDEALSKIDELKQ